MVKFRDLTDELFEKNINERRCPHIRRDEEGAYCSRGLKKGEEIYEGRRLVCGSISLQMWCLTKRHWTKCIYYKGEPFD